MLYKSNRKITWNSKKILSLIILLLGIFNTCVFSTIKIYAEDTIDNKEEQVIEKQVDNLTEEQADTQINNNEIIDTNIVNSVNNTDKTNQTQNNLEIDWEDNTINENNNEIDNKSNKDNVLDDTNVDSNVLEYIKDRTKRLEDKIGINQETETEKETDKIEKELNNKSLEKSILEEVWNILNQKTLEITKDIKSKEDTLAKLNEELIKEKEKLITNENKIKELEDKIKNYKKSIADKEKLIIWYKEEKIINENKIKELNSSINELLVYKKKYEEKVQEEKAKEFSNLLKNIWIYLLFSFLYFLIYLFFQKRKDKLKEEKNFKRLNRIVIVEVLIWIAFVLFTIIYLIIINPWIGIVFVIMGWSIIVSIRPIIASFISSFNVITNYKLNDKIEVNKQFGEIKSINLLSTTLKLYDKGTLTSLNKTVKIPNTFFSEKEVIRYRKDEFLKTFIIKVNFKDLTKSIEEFFADIDNLFFKDNIEIINNIQKKRYFLSIKWTGNQEFEFEFKYKDKDWTNIDKKIIEYIQSIIKIEDKDNKNEEEQKNENIKENEEKK